MMPVSDFNRAFLPVQMQDVPSGPDKVVAEEHGFVVRQRDVDTLRGVGHLNDVVKESSKLLLASQADELLLTHPLLPR